MSNTPLPQPNPITLQGIGAAISEVLKRGDDEAKRAKARADKVDAEFLATRSELREIRLEQLRTDTRLDRVEGRLDKIEERIDLVEQRVTERITPVDPKPGKYSLMKPMPVPVPAVPIASKWEGNILVKAQAIAKARELVSMPPPPPFELKAMPTGSGDHARVEFSEIQKFNLYVAEQQAFARGSKEAVEGLLREEDLSTKRSEKWRNWAIFLLALVSALAAAFVWVLSNLKLVPH